MTRRVRIAATASGLGLAALIALPLLAQDDGGLRLTFGLSARVDATSNPGLTVPRGPAKNSLSTRLNFGLTDATRAGAVSLAAAGTLSTNTGDGSAIGLVDPDLRFSLRRDAATTSLELLAFLRQSDLDTLRGLILDPGTGAVIGDVVGDGTQRQTGGAVTYTFGKGGPWGGTLSAALTDTTYSGTTTEVDNRRSEVGGTLRFALDPATMVTAGLRWSRYDADGSTSRDTLRPELGLRRDLPAGFASVSLFAEDTEDGTRTGLSFGRSWQFPDGSLSVNLGASRSVTGDFSATGAVDWRKELARSTLNLSLRRDIAAGSNDAETLVTTASFGLVRAISPLSSVNFGLEASESAETATNLVTRNAALSVTFSQNLQQDWVLDAGITHRLRDESGPGQATSDTAFLELRRNFELRP